MHIHNTINSHNTMKMKRTKHKNSFKNEGNEKIFFLFFFLWKVNWVGWVGNKKQLCPYTHIHKRAQDNILILSILFEGNFWEANKRRKAFWVAVWWLIIDLDNYKGKFYTDFFKIGAFETKTLFFVNFFWERSPLQ